MATFFVKRRRMGKNKYLCLYRPEVTLEGYIENVNSGSLRVGKELGRWSQWMGVVWLYTFSKVKH